MRKREDYDYSTPSQVDRYIDAAKASVELTRTQIRELAQANQQLVQGTAVTTYTATGQATFAAVVIWEKLQVTLDFGANGGRIQFNANLWGVAFGGGTSFGGGVFTLPPSQLLGDANVQANVAAVGTTITWWRNGQFLGNFTGGRT